MPKKSSPCPAWAGGLARSSLVSDGRRGGLGFPWKACGCCYPLAPLPASLGSLLTLGLAGAWSDIPCTVKTCVCVKSPATI